MRVIPREELWRLFDESKDQSLLLFRRRQGEPSQEDPRGQEQGGRVDQSAKRERGQREPGQEDPRGQEQGDCGDQSAMRERDDQWVKGGSERLPNQLPYPSLASSPQGAAAAIAVSPPPSIVSLSSSGKAHGKLALLQRQYSQRRGLSQRGKSQRGTSQRGISQQGLSQQLLRRLPRLRLQAGIYRLVS